MSRWLIALLFVSATAHAAPPELRDDDMNQLLVNRSLISQLREARHHMAERTSDFVKEARQSVAEKTSDLVVTAMGFIGVPYRRGGNSAETGFDCSGFVRAIYSETLGKVLPRRADQQAQATEKIDKNELKPGDLVFFNTMRRAFSHVGIYVGDGNFIHAPAPVHRCAWKACKAPTGPAASMAPVACRTPTAWAWMPARLPWPCRCRQASCSNHGGLSALPQSRRLQMQAFCFSGHCTAFVPG